MEMYDKGPLKCLNIEPRWPFAGGGLVLERSEIYKHVFYLTQTS